MIPGAYRLICLAKFVIPTPVGLPVFKKRKKKVAPKEQYLRFPDIPTHAHTIVLIHIHTEEKTVVVTVSCCYLLYTFCHVLQGNTFSKF